MPVDAEILDVQVQDGHITLWALVDIDGGNLTHPPRMFHVIGTGVPFVWDTEVHMQYFGTVQMGGEVWHILEVG